MDEYDDLSQYDGNAVHDMNVDFDNFMNTGELADYFDDDSDEEWDDDID